MNSHSAPSAFPGVWLPPQLDPFKSMPLTACISQSQSSVMIHNPSVAGPAPDMICFFLPTSAGGFPPCQHSGTGLKASVAVRPSGSLDRRVAHGGVDKPSVEGERVTSPPLPSTTSNCKGV